MPAVAGVASPLVVVASGAWVDGLDVGGEVDRVVELAVAVSGQSVADDVAAAGFDRCGAGVAGKVVGAGEPADVADVGRRILAASTSLIPASWVRVVPLAATAAAQRRRFSASGFVEGAARSARRSRAICLRSASTAVVGDGSWRSRPAAVLALRWTGAPPGIRSRRCRCSRLSRSAPFPGQFVATIRQQPAARSRWSSAADSREIGALGGDDRDRGGRRCGRSCGRGPSRGSAPAPPASRGHVDDMLAGGDESLGQQLTQAASAFDRPAALGPPGCPAQQLLQVSSGSPALGSCRPRPGQGRSRSRCARPCADQYR